MCQNLIKEETNGHLAQPHNLISIHPGVWPEKSSGSNAMSWAESRNDLPFSGLYWGEIKKL